MREGNKRLILSLKWSPHIFIPYNENQSFFVRKKNMFSIHPDRSYFDANLASTSAAATYNSSKQHNL